MKDFFKKLSTNKNALLLFIGSIIALLIMILSVTYAYFESEIAEAATGDVVVDIATLEEFTFTTTGDLNLNVTPTLLPENGNNLEKTATATVSLKKSDKEENDVTKNYYVYLNIHNNTFTYTNGTTPEIILNVYLDNTEVTLTGLTQKTQNGVTGYDITTYSGLIKIGDPQAITSTSSEVATTQNWLFKITYLNLDNDQSANIGAVLETQLIITKEEPTYCYLHPSDLACEIDNTFDGFTNNTMTLANGYIYHHDANLTNGANDGGYRYAGANPNNYVCFGSDAVTCPTNNIYRIIGQIPVDVVTDATTTPVTTETQMLYKLIKHDYITSTEIGMTAANNSEPKASPYEGPSGNQPIGDVEGFYWSGSSSNCSNTWSSSTLNTSGLNGSYLTNIGNAWSNRIATVMWKVGGGDDSYMRTATPMSTVYTNEITESGEHVTSAPTDGKNEYAAKVGLMYVSDYGYAAPSASWSTVLGSYNSVVANNWLYRGIMEWTVSREAKYTWIAYNVHMDGHVSGSLLCNVMDGVRPVLYLNSSTTIDMTNHLGTLSDPYRIN